MLITSPANYPNAFDLRETYRLTHSTMYVHRHPGEHLDWSPDVDPTSCWCEPLTLEPCHMRALHIIELQRLLAQHFAIQ